MKYLVTIEYLPPGSQFEDGVRLYTKVISATSPAVAISRAMKFAPRTITESVQDILVEEFNG